MSSDGLSRGTAHRPWTTNRPWTTRIYIYPASLTMEHMERTGYSILWMVPVMAGIMLILTGSGGGTAETITVDHDGSADFTTIQEAINAAKDGDTIRVFDGEYHGLVILDRSVSLIGNGSSRTKIIGNGTIVSIRAPRVEVAGFSVAGDGVSKYYSACIKMERGYGDEARIRDNHCSENSVGIMLESATKTDVINNTCSETRHGIYLSSSQDNSITGNRLLNNSIGIYVYNFDDRNAISGNTFSGNEKDLHSEQDEHVRDAQRKFFAIMGAAILISVLIVIMAFPPWKPPDRVPAGPDGSADAGRTSGAEQERKGNEPGNTEGPEGRKEEPESGNTEGPEGRKEEPEPGNTEGLEA